MRYPDEIDGIKQEQNPVKRFFIWLWYSDLFRVLMPIFILIFFSVLLGNRLGGDISLAAIVILLFLLAIFNDYSNLRRIGRDEFRRKLCANFIDEKWERDFGEPLRWKEVWECGIRLYQCEDCKRITDEWNNYCPSCGVRLMEPEE